MESFNETIRNFFYPSSGEINPAVGTTIPVYNNSLPSSSSSSSQVQESFITINNFCWQFFKLYALTGLIFYSSLKHYHKFPIHSFILFSSETLFYFFTVFLLLPVLLLLLIVNFIIRLILTLYFKFLNIINNSNSEEGEIELMNGNDGFWAYDEFANSCNFTSLLVMEGECNLNKIRKLYCERIMDKIVNGELFYKKYRKKPISKFGYYCWQYDKNFDIKNHIKYLNTSTTTNSTNLMEPLTESQVFHEIEKLLDYPMPDKYPKWEFLLVPNYIYNDDPRKATNNDNDKGSPSPTPPPSYFAIIIRMHHSYTDGISGSHVLQTGFADTIPKLAVDPMKPINISFGLLLLKYASMVFLGPRAFFRTVLLDESNCFHSGKPLTGPKMLSWSKPIRLESLKAIRNHIKCTTTSIFVSSIVGALKTIGNRKGFTVPKLIHAFPTIAMLPYPNVRPQNRFTVSLLPTSMEGSVMNRLNSIYKAFKILEAAPDIPLSFLSMKIIGLFPSIITKFFSENVHATLLVSNVPGPIESCNVFDGCKWIDMSAWAPIRFGTGIGVGFYSYDGKVRACVVADASCLNQPDDVSALIQEFEKEVLELCKSSGISWKNVFVE